MNNAQIAAAWGKTFDAPGVINGCSRVRFCGVWPSGNVAVKRDIDPDSFGPLTVSADTAKLLIAAIERVFNARGFRRID